MSDFISLKKKLILASNSPRRKTILEEVGLEPIVIPSDVSEDISETNPKRMVEELSKRKAESISANYPEDIVIGADTIVVCNGIICGKPEGRKGAYEMLSLLSGNTNHVYTGVSICVDNDTHTFCEETAVKMYENSSELIQAYVNTGIPLDKSGSYGIQGYGSVLIESIKGDYYSVMGLPIGRVVRLLFDLGLVNINESK